MRWLCTGGTRLATPHGSIAVEQLLPGTPLLSADGATLLAGPVGRIRLSAAELAKGPALWPVHIAANALADGLPAHDVAVLPNQPIAIPGLPPIAATWLVDGVALRRPPPREPLDVFSLETSDTPAALCLREDTGEPPRPADALLLAARQHLATRAGIAAGPLLGSVDTVTAAGMSGWADDGSGHPVALELTIDGIIRPPVLSDQPRDDLAAAGIGDGRRGFTLKLEPPLQPRHRHLLRIRRALDGAELPGSPILLDAVADLATILDAMPPDVVQAAVRAVAARLAAHP